jgi:hypothetical protein
MADGGLRPTLGLFRFSLGFGLTVTSDPSDTFFDRALSLFGASGDAVFIHLWFPFRFKVKPRNKALRS